MSPFLTGEFEVVITKSPFSSAPVTAELLSSLAMTSTLTRLAM